MISSRFADTIALVTGAAGGIGLAIARRLATEGCRVMLTDIDGERLHRATDGLAATGAEVVAEVADLAEPGERDRLVPAVLERWGRIDVLVNNAAYHGPRTPFLELPEEEWQRVLAANVTATAALCRAAANDMLTRGEGAIVNVGSVQATMPVATYSAYVASKGAILALTRALAVELSPHGIRVNAVTPGVIATAAFQHALAGGRSEKTKRTAPASLLCRDGSPEEVAAVVAFLASSDASFVTGAELRVDGGRSISRRPDPFETEFGELQAKSS